MSEYDEDHYEQTLIELFCERLGYDCQIGYDIQSSFADKDYYCPVYRERLQTMLRQLNCSTSKPATWCRTTSSSWTICNTA